MTLDEFLAWENTQEARHEFYHGDIFLMSGALPTHARVVGNLYFALRTQLGNQSCQQFLNHPKLKWSREQYSTQTSS